MTAGRSSPENQIPSPARVKKAKNLKNDYKVLFIGLLQAYNGVVKEKTFNGGPDMAHKIGFLSEENEVSEIAESTAKHVATAHRNALVQVYFEGENRSFAYYNDSFDLHPGDFVYVEGHFEGRLGRVGEINYNFKIKLSDYKRIISVVDTEVHGEFFTAGSHFITFRRQAIPKEKIIGWFKAPLNGGEEFVSGTDPDTAFPLANLADMNVSPKIAENGHEYYIENRVKYICLDGEHGYAIVQGRENYEVEFVYTNGMISQLTCSCFCSYNCKHEFAAMLQLRETLDLIEKDYGGKCESNGYFAAIAKGTLFHFAIDGKHRGCFSM